MAAKRNVTDGKSAEGTLRCGATPTSADETDGDTFTLEVPVVIRLTCDCAVADEVTLAAVGLVCIQS